MSTCFIFFVIFPLFVDCQQYQTKKFQQVTYKSEIHKRLVNHVYKITHGNDPQHCLSDCWSENHICQSFNYLALQDLCELNNASAIDFASDLETFDMSVYFTNPAFGDKVAPSIERNNITYPSTPPDVCASGPCKSGQCVLDDKLGFRCVNCSAGYYGKMCELFKDPCLSSPCLYEGVCSSQPGATSFTCACTTRFSGTRCQDGVADYDINLESASQYPKYKMDNSISLSQMTLCFWYKTSQTLSYFFSYTPDDAQRNEQILIWRNETKVYVRLGDNDIQSFDDFQFIDGVAWNHLCVVWNITAGEMTLYSQGAQRNDANISHISASFQLSPGYFYLGYYAHPTDGAQYFTGHMSQLNIWDYVKSTAEILALSEACLSEPGNVWNWTNIMWKGGNIEKPGATCTTRVPSKTYNVFKFKYHASYTAELYISEKQLDTDSLTISVWFRLANTGREMRIIELNRASTTRIYLAYTDTAIEFQLNNKKTTVKLPIFKSTWCHLVVTWSGLNDTVEFILNGVWQSWKKNYFLLSAISESLGASVGVHIKDADKFDGEIANVNIWKRILPAAYIAAMSRYAGDDIGDHFAWKDFTDTAPTTACYELIMARHENIVRERPTQLSFGENSGSVETTVMTTDLVTELTICLWFKLSSFRPVKLVTHNLIASSTVLLELALDADHIINLNMSGVAIAVSPVLEDSYTNQWQHLCVAWSNSHRLLSWFRWNSVESATFMPGVKILYPAPDARDHLIYISNKLEYLENEERYEKGHTLNFQGPWIIGKNANGENIEGSIAHVNVWSTYLDTYSTLAKGVMNLEGDLVTWPQFVNNSLSGVTLEFADELFLPDWDILLKRDLYCASLDAEQCYEYARTAWDLNGFTWACVCPGALHSRGIATHQDLNSSLSTILSDLAT